MSTQQHDSSSHLDVSTTNTLETTEPSGHSAAGHGGVRRRTVLRASALTLGGLAMSTSAAAGPTDSDGTEKQDRRLGPPDTPSGFGVEVLSGYASFPDSVSARFEMGYDGGAGTVVSNLQQDASTVIVAKVTWQPEGTSGWHTHPGPVVVSVAEGEVAVVNERDCIRRTYAAGEAFVDPGQGNVHVALNPSTTDTATAYATFIGVPDGGAPTILVPAVEC